MPDLEPRYYRFYILDCYTQYLYMLDNMGTERTECLSDSLSSSELDLTSY